MIYTLPDSIASQFKVTFPFSSEKLVSKITSSPISNVTRAPSIWFPELSFTVIDILFVPYGTDAGWTILHSTAGLSIISDSTHVLPPSPSEFGGIVFEHVFTIKAVPSGWSIVGEDAHSHLQSK